jgi:hypothetical protein
MPHNWVLRLQPDKYECTECGALTKGKEKALPDAKARIPLGVYAKIMASVSEEQYFKEHTCEEIAALVVGGL